MDDQNRNLILATALSMVVILVWFVLFPPPEAPVDPNAPVDRDGAARRNRNRRGTSP
jgi:YidC/Oxa1 family membrane protein insertase